jgi:hypothetical protein
MGLLIMNDHGNARQGAGHRPLQGRPMKPFAAALTLVLLVASSSRAELRIPAFTAYLDPHPNAASVSEKSGVTRWLDPADKVIWFGQINSAGKIDCALSLRLSDKVVSKLRLTLAGQSHDSEATGAGADSVTIRFGAFDIASPGYQRFALESLNPVGQPAGDLDALILDGPSAQDAHFNLKPRRNAASVHLTYPIPKDAKVDAFYCEATGIEDPVATYYMACGWNRGYLGMQVNSETERRIIFSVWDSGHEGIDRKKVADADRVALIAKGDGVFTGDFGHEGTGGHSHFVYPWKTGEVQRFIVTAKVIDATDTIFSGFWFQPEKKQWMLISSWRAPKDGAYLRGLYSFNENFGGNNGHLRRKALFGNQWIRLTNGAWSEITTATFSHDATGKVDRLDRFMGVEKGEFFLSNGGFIEGFTKFGDPFTRPASGKPPADLTLPDLPK